MKALTFKRYGKSPEIGLTDIPRPALKADEMLVQVYAAGLNPIDNMIPTGMFKPVLHFQLPATLGSDLAGVLPIMRQRRYYRWPIPNLAGWMHGNCFLGAPLVAAGLEREFWQALLDWADRHAGIGLFLHLSGMPLAGPLHAALIDVLRV